MNATLPDAECGSGIWKANMATAKLSFGQIEKGMAEKSAVLSKAQPFWNELPGSPIPCFYRESRP
jgi:hypothetical protein